MSARRGGCGSPGAWGAGTDLQPGASRGDGSHRGCWLQLPCRSCAAFLSSLGRGEGEMLWCVGLGGETAESAVAPGSVAHVTDLIFRFGKVS